MANLEGLGEFPRRIPKVPEVKRLRGASEGDEETVTTALPRDDESPHNVDDKVADFFGKKNLQMTIFLGKIYIQDCYYIGTIDKL